VAEAVREARGVTWDDGRNLCTAVRGAARYEERLAGFDQRRHGGGEYRMRDITTRLDAIERFLQQEGDVLLARHREQAPCDTTAPLEAALWTARDALRTAKRALAQSRGNAPEAVRNAIDAHERLLQALRRVQEHAPL